MTAFGRSSDELAAMHSANDPWAARRKTDPVLRAVVNVLCAHTEVSYYCVDWRGALFGATCRSEEKQLERGLIQDPDAICGSQSLPYMAPTLGSCPQVQSRRRAGVRTTELRGTMLRVNRRPR